MTKLLYLLLGIGIGAVSYYLYISQPYKGPRQAQYPVEKNIISRWSPRSFTGDTVSKKELMSLFEAARWAPSSNNKQPWRFVFALQDTHGWQRILDTLVSANQAWAIDAGALIVALSKAKENGKEIKTHSLDTGSAVQNLALQAHAMGLATHAMGGFNREALTEAIKVPEDYVIEAVYAVGKQGPKNKLSQPLQDREVPSDRKPFSEFVFEDTFGKSVK